MHAAVLQSGAWPRSNCERALRLVLVLGSVACGNLGHLFT